MSATVQRIGIFRQEFAGTLTVLDCARCGVTFAITADFESRRRNDHESFYCPSGHSQCFPQQSDEEKAKAEAARLRERLRTTERSERFYRDQAATERRRAAAARGQRTRVLNLITKGICPVAGCRRNFTNVREHMASEHPDFHTHEATS